MFPARIRMPLLIVAALLCPVLAAQRTHMSDIAGWNPVPASSFFLSAVMASHPFVEVVDARSVATDLAYSNVFADETFGDNITFVDRSRKNIQDCKEQALLEIWPDVYVDGDSPSDTYYSYENDEYRDKIALMEARFEECESRAPNESSSDTDDGEFYLASSSMIIAHSTILLTCYGSLVVRLLLYIPRRYHLLTCVIVC